MMNRKTINLVKSMCAELDQACDDALFQLDAEVESRNHWAHDGEVIEPSDSDISYGGKLTGALRRKSMDMTRLLAELRRTRP